MCTYLDIYIGGGGARNRIFRRDHTGMYSKMCVYIYIYIPVSVYVPGGHQAHTGMYQIGTQLMIIRHNKDALKIRSAECGPKLAWRG